MSGNGDGNIKLSQLVVQIIVTVLISGAASFVGMLQGSAVIKSQMLDHDKRITGLEVWKKEVDKQQIELYRMQALSLQKQLEDIKR